MDNIQDKQAKPKRVANFWIRALKKWNEGQAQYTIPKKGSAEYDQVKAIEAEMRSS